MKVRIGIGTGGAGLDPTGLGALVDDMATLGFDSIWLPEVLSTPGFDPMVALAWVAGHRPGLKVGTTMLLPGRNLIRTAKQVASLDVLSQGRFLLTFVPGLPNGPERTAVGVPPAERGAAMDEALPLLRRLWAGERVTYHGPLGELDDVTVTPQPVQKPFDVWFGGSARAALERCGRIGDGWLPAMCTPEEAEAGRKVVDQAAADAGRSISPEHFGVSLGYARQPLDAAVTTALSARARGRPLETLVPVGLAALRERVQQFIDAGFSKFVARPIVPPTDWRSELEELAGAVGDLQT
jgi:probable F420-dependent oxidoreductase